MNSRNTKEEILLTSLKLFSEKGFEAVSTSMIASNLGITKGALYRHFESKQDIFDSIIARMFELDARQAEKNNVPVNEYPEDESAYRNTAFGDLCEFVNDQLIFWTENDFARQFRRMITISQFRNSKMSGLYQDVLSSGPVKYTENLFREMINNGQLNERARELGAMNLAIMLFAPLQLSIQFYDGGECSETISQNLRTITKNFEVQYMERNTNE